jgi:hypothetical protein
VLNQHVQLRMRLVDALPWTQVTRCRSGIKYLCYLLLSKPLRLIDITSSSGIHPHRYTAMPNPSLSQLSDTITLSPTLASLQEDIRLSLLTPYNQSTESPRGINRPTQHRFRQQQGVPSSVMHWHMRSSTGAGVLCCEYVSGSYSEVTQ